MNMPEMPAPMTIASYVRDLILVWPFRQDLGVRHGVVPLFVITGYRRTAVSGKARGLRASTVTGVNRQRDESYGASFSTPAIRGSGKRNAGTLAD